MRQLTRRSVVFGAGAFVAAPWTAARAQAVGVPRFSASAPGATLPAGWVHETLPKVERANQFALAADGGTTVLHVRSQAAASSLVAALPATSGTVARVQWRWKVSRPLAGSDFRVKGGDDYAARLYVLFDLPLERLAFGDRMRILAARSLSGRDIPTAAICYVWGQAQAAGATGWNPYTDRVRMVVVDSGPEFAGQWRNVQRDVARDWQEAFPGPMPAVRAVAVGADTDNTGEQVDTWFGDVLLDQRHMKRLLLLGGGHAHLRVLADLARAPLPGWEVLLVTPAPRQIYSGMLPGWVAGHYALEQCGIDVARLAAAAGVRLVLDNAQALDAQAQSVQTAANGSLDFDRLSLDVGSARAAGNIPGTLEHATAIRPVEQFVAGWEATQARLRQSRPFDLVVLGAGLGGVELAFAAQQRGLREGWSHLRVHLVGSESTPLETTPAATQRRVLELLHQKAMHWHGGKRAAAVEQGQLRLADGGVLPADACWLVTGSASHPWLAGSGLATDATGYVRVRSTLQSESHPAIFAAGDTASLQPPLPKSGVYAVRAGAALSRNLQAACRGMPLTPWQPQARALYLVSTGSRHALAVWDGRSFDGRWVWRWKDWIDRRFVRGYNAG